jgi:ERCC4-type nuclease
MTTLYTTEEVNDDDLYRALGSSAVRCPIEFGDCTFFGKWTDDVDIRVLVERKRIRDMGSSILTGRYMNQAQAAHEAGFDKLILIVEGDIRPDRDGSLMTKSSDREQTTRFVSGKRKPRVTHWYTVEPQISYGRFNEYLDELSLYCGILVKRSANVVETAAQIKSLWQLFQQPPSKHGSLEVFYRQPPPRMALLSKPSLMRRIAAELPNVGWERSDAIERHFPTIVDMVNADEEDWLEIPGIGKKTAHDVIIELRAKRNIK